MNGKDVINLRHILYSQTCDVKSAAARVVSEAARAKESGIVTLVIAAIGKLEELTDIARETAQKVLREVEGPELFEEDNEEVKKWQTC